MTIAYTVLFADLGKLIDLHKVLNTARLTTIPGELEDATDRIDPDITALDTDERDLIFGTLPEAVQSWSDSGDALASTIQASAQALLIAHVIADEQQVSNEVDPCLDELIRQMTASTQSVDRSTSAASFSVDQSKGGNGTLAVSVTRPDGKHAEFCLAESVAFEVTGEAIGNEAWDVGGEPAADLLAEDWPAGSGADLTIASVGVDSNANILENGGFEESDDNNALVPDGWKLPNSTAADLVSMTSIEIQTLVVSGDPAAGSYVIRTTDGGGLQTSPLSYAATASDVQAALRLWPGYGDVTVASTGTSPNLTHAVTFTRVYNPSALSAEATFDRNEIQTLSATGTVSGGQYKLRLDGQTTADIAFGANNATILAALELLSNIAPGDVTLGGGSLPGTPVTITFGGAYANRDVSLMTVEPGTSPLTGGGSYGIVESTKGRGVQNVGVTPATESSAAVYQHARAIHYASNGTSSGAFLAQPVTLEPGVQYAFCVAVAVDTAPTNGTLLVRLTAGIGGSVLADSASTNNSISLDLATAGSSFSLLTGFFRTPLSYVPSQTQLYLEFNMDSGDILDNGRALYIDNAILIPATELYSGGPWVGIFSGSSPWKIGHRYLLAVTNDRAGEIHEWCRRYFGMAESGKLLPTNNAGSETIADASYIGV